MQKPGGFLLVLFLQELHCRVPPPELGVDSFLCLVNFHIPNEGIEVSKVTELDRGAGRPWHAVQGVLALLQNHGNERVNPPQRRVVWSIILTLTTLDGVINNEVLGKRRGERSASGGVTRSEIAIKMAADQGVKLQGTILLAFREKHVAHLLEELLKRGNGERERERESKRFEMRSAMCRRRNVSDIPS